MSVQFDRVTAGTESVGARSQRIDVLIFSSDDELLIELGPALGDPFRSRQIERLEELGGALQGRRAIAVLDTGGSVDARRVYAELNSRSGDVPIIVITGADQRAGWESALQRGAIAALLTRDTHLTEQFAKMLTAAAKALEAPRTATGGGATGGTPRASRPMWPVFVGAAVVLGGIGVWWMTRDHATPPVAGSLPVPAGSQGSGAANPGAREEVSVSVPQLLSAARVAFGEQRYLEPAGNNALDLFQRVLQKEPDNAEARDGVLRLFDIIRARSDAALKAGHIDEADSLLSAVKLVAPDSDLARDLGRSVAQERPRWLANQVRTSLAAGNIAQAQKYFDQIDGTADKRILQDLQRALETKQRELQTDGAAAAVHAAVAAGNLVEPGAGNAHALWNAIPAADRKTPAVQTVQKEYQFALIALARDQWREQRFDSAERYLSTAAELGATAELADARKALASAQETAEKINAAARASAAARTNVVADTPAATSAGPSTDEPRYTKVTVKKAVEPAYPAAARERKQEGYVDVRFNLTPDGKPINISVLQSSPPGVFDEAALDSVRRWLFEPVPVAAGAPPPLARRRVIFRLKG